MKNNIIALALALVTSPAWAQQVFWSGPPIIPPPEYEKPHDGIIITVERAPGSAEGLCNKANIYTTIACSQPRNGSCHIMIASDEWLAKKGTNYNIVLRHELAHCPPNWWPADHPGARMPTRADYGYPTRVTNPFTGQPMGR